MKKKIRILFLGDTQGEPGVAMFKKWTPILKEKHKIDAIFVNGENSAKNGKGITPELVKEFKKFGASVITSGNHVWGNKKIYSLIDDKNEILLRPANYPSVCPGRGHIIIDVDGVDIAVINIQGRVFMAEDLDCPFRCVESLLTFLKNRAKIVFVDFHAETTSEKQAMLHFLNGKVSGLFGTHTHVQTADERITEEGTSYITDLGFAGALNSSLGVEYNIILNRFLTQMPAQFKIEKNGPMTLNGVWVEVDTETGNAVHIERVNITDSVI